jgi:hypothetical protein
MKVTLRIEYLGMQSRVLPDDFVDELVQRASRRQWKFYLPGAHNRPQRCIEIHDHMPILQHSFSIRQGFILGFNPFKQGNATPQEIYLQLAMPNGEAKSYIARLRLLV